MYLPPSPHTHNAHPTHAQHSKADVTVTDTESYTPLMSAVQAGHVEAFKVLLSKDSAIDETDEDGKTIVHLAAEGNHVDILKVSVCVCVHCVHTLSLVGNSKEQRWFEVV